MFKDIYYYFVFPKDPIIVADRLAYKLKNKSIYFVITKDFQKQIKWSKLSDSMETFTLLKICASSFAFGYYYFLNQSKISDSYEVKNYCEEIALELKKNYASSTIKKNREKGETETLEKIIERTIENCDTCLCTDKEFKSKNLEILDYINAVSWELYVFLRNDKIKKKDVLLEIIQKFHVSNYVMIEKMFTFSFKNHVNLVISNFKKHLNLDK